MKAAPRTEAWNAAILISFAAITILPIVGIVLLSLQPGDAPLSGFDLPEGNVHSPNERLLVRYIPLGVQTSREVLARFASLR